MLTFFILQHHHSPFFKTWHIIKIYVHKVYSRMSVHQIAQIYLYISILIYIRQGRSRKWKSLPAAFVRIIIYLFLSFFFFSCFEALTSTREFQFGMFCSVKGKLFGAWASLMKGKVTCLIFIYVLFVEGMFLQIFFFLLGWWENSVFFYFCCLKNRTTSSQSN